MCSWICREPLLWLLKMLSPAVCLPKYLLQHESIKCILHIRKDLKNKQPTFRNVMFFTGRFILDFCSGLLSELSAKLLPEYLKAFGNCKCAPFCQICGLYFDVWWLNLLCPRHACTHILNICVPPQQTEHSATTWSSMNCAQWRMKKALARRSKSDSSSTSTTDTANCLNTEAVEETPTILGRWRSVRKLVWSQVSLTTTDSPQKFNQTYLITVIQRNYIFIGALDNLALCGIFDNHTIAQGPPCHIKT